MIQAVIFDLDGVLRRWSVRETWAIERRHGLARGSIAGAAFGPALLQSAVTGAISDARWRDTVARTLGARRGPAGRRAVVEWSRLVGDVDPAVLELVRDIRGEARTALLTNSTTRLAGDLMALGLASELDLVVNSADLGRAKPDPAVFVETARLLSVDVEACAFVDDDPVNVAAARSVGMATVRHRDAAITRRKLVRLGVRIGDGPCRRRSQSAISR